MFRAEFSPVKKPNRRANAEESACHPLNVRLTVRAHSDGRYYSRRYFRRASAAERGLETRGRAALRRLGHEQGLRAGSRLSRRRVLVLTNYSGGLRADRSRRTELWGHLRLLS